MYVRSVLSKRSGSTYSAAATTAFTSRAVESSDAQNANSTIVVPNDCVNVAGALAYDFTIRVTARSRSTLCSAFAF